MGIFNRGKDKSQKQVKNLAEDLAKQRAEVLNEFNGCIIGFENSNKNNFTAEEMLYCNKTLNLLKLSFNTLRDISLRVNAAELSYLEEISKKINDINDGLSGSVSIGVTTADGKHLQGITEKKAVEIYAIVWQWLHI